MDHLTSIGCICGCGCGDGGTGSKAMKAMKKPVTTVTNVNAPHAIVPVKKKNWVYPRLAKSKRHANMEKRVKGMYTYHVLKSCFEMPK